MLLGNLARKVTGVAQRNPELLVRQGVILPAMPALDTNTIKATLDSQDSQPERRRVGQPGYVHVSSLIGLCTRQYALIERRGDAVYNDVRGAHRIMWAMGRAVERHIRDQYIAARQRQGVYGEWHCRCGHTSFTGFYPSQSRCTRCTHGLTNYREAPMFDHDARIVGNTDLPFLHGEYIVPTEIKSMTKHLWDKLDNPLPDHVFQASMYQYLYRKNGFKTHDEVVIIYASKDFNGYGSPYKEFHVNVMSADRQRQVEFAVQQAMEIKRAREGQLPPRCGACPNHDAPTAKKCPVVVPCFNMPA